MTILNVWRSPRRVLIASDTLGGDARDDAPLTINKLLHLPVQNIVLAGSGIVGLLQGVFNGVLQQPVTTFDEYESGLAELCDGIMDALLEQNVGLNRELAVMMHMTLAMAGWSDKTQQMRAVRCTRSPGASLFQVHEVQLYALSPNGPWSEAAAKGAFPPAPDTPDKVFKCAKQQLAWWPTAYPKYPTGGRLIVAELTRYGLNMTSRELPSAAVGDQAANRSAQKDRSRS